MRPHLAYVFERFPSFTQTFCAREVLELERQGLQPLLFSIRDTRTETPRHFPAELYDRVHFLPPEKELVEWVKSEKKANRLPQEIVLSLRQWGQRPDKLRVYEAAYVGSRLRAAGVRHVHSHFAGIGARVGWWLRQAFDCTFSFTGHANDIWCEEPGLDVTLDRLMADASLIVTVSDFTANQLRERFPASATRIHRVYNGLDLAPFAAASAGRGDEKAEGPPLILSVGRLIEKKGFPDLIAACARLRDAGTAFQCEIAGDGPLEPDLRQLIDDLKLENRVRLLGAVSQEAIVRTLSRTRVFALACTTERDGGMDNLPTVLMEAMAAGVPCVSTRLAGVPEMVDHGVTGLLVGDRNPDALASALQSILSDPERGAQLGKAGLQRAQTLFAQESTAPQLLRLFARHGLMRFDPALARRHPSLWPAYARQAAGRLARIARGRGLKHRLPPDFLLPTPPA